MPYEDMIIDDMLKQNIGFNAYGQMDEVERATAARPAYEYLQGRYQERDMPKYERLSFEDYSRGLTPEEIFISELRGDKPSAVATQWYESFGEDTDLMKAAAFDYGRTYTTDYPKSDYSYGEGYNTAKNTYNQGQ